jgi:hypothetical protein
MFQPIVLGSFDSQPEVRQNIMVAEALRRRIVHFMAETEEGTRDQVHPSKSHHE